MDVIDFQDAPANPSAILPIDRFKAFSAMAETSRKWVVVMDAKAAFMSGLNAALLTCLWAGFKFGDAKGAPLWLAIFASFFLAISMALAVSVVLPRSTLSSALKSPMKYQGTLRPISFYGFVATQYPAGKFNDFRLYVMDLDNDDLALESLEQHYVISHVVQSKSNVLGLAGISWLLALLIATIAVPMKIFCI